MRPSTMRRALVITLAFLVVAGAGLHLFGALRSTHSTREEFQQKRREVFQRHGIQAASRFVTLAEPAIETHFLEAGSGLPVVVIHGGGGDGSGWVSILEPLSREFRLLVPDRPGHGLSQSFDYSGVSFRRHAAAFVASFLDSQGLDRVSLVGNSMGGYFSLAFALENPERVEKLVLIGAPAGIDLEVPLPMRIMGVPGLNTWLVTVMGGFRGDEPPPMPPFLVAQPDLVPKDLLEMGDLAARLPGVQESFLSMLVEVLTIRGFNPTYYIRDELDRVAAPTLFIWGDRDAFAPPASGEEAVERMPNARIVIVPGVGHLPWIEAPEVCAYLIADFLRPPPGDNPLPDGAALLDETND